MERICSGGIDEEQRLRVLRSYRLLDTAPDPAFDDLARLAASICLTPIAGITLIDECRQWFKSSIGVAVREMDRAYSFCDHTIRQQIPLVVRDMATDPRFAGNPLVHGGPRLRFYAGVPLKSALGPTLGALMVVDSVPRDLDARQIDALTTLAAQVSHLMEMHRERMQHQRTAEELREAQSIGGMGSWRYELDERRLVWSDEVYRIYGQTPETFDQTFEGMLRQVPPEDRHLLENALAEALQKTDLIEFYHRIRRPDGALRRVRLRGHRVEHENLIAGTVQDVTDEHDAAERMRLGQAELEQAYALLKFHLDNSPMASVEWDHEFRIVRWSPQAQAMFRWLPEEVIGKRPRDWPFVHADDAGQVEGIVSQLVSGLVVRNVSDNRNVTGDGRVIHCQWHNSARLDPEGRVTSIFSLVLDRSEQVRADAAAAETLAQERIARAQALARERKARAEAEATKHHFRALFESVPGAYAVLEPEAFRIVAASDAYLTKVRGTREAVVGRLLPELLRGLASETGLKSLTLLQASLRAVVAERRTDTMRVQAFPLASADAPQIFEEHFWSTLNAPIFGPDGRLVYVMHRIEDVTEFVDIQADGWTVNSDLARRQQLMEAETALQTGELRRLNQHLRASEERFRHLVADAATGIATISLEGQLLGANAAFCGIVGHDEDVLKSFRLIELAHAEDSPALQAALNALVDGTQENLVLECRLRAADARAIWVRLSLSRQLGDDGAATNLIGVAEDLTPERLAQEQLRTSQMLSRLAGTIGRIGGWAADLKTGDIYWSQEIFEILEWSIDRPPRLDEAMALYPAPYRQDMTRRLRTCAEHGVAFDIEVQIDTASGRRAWVRVAAEPDLTADRSIERIVGAFQDITARKHAELERKRLSDLLGKTLDNMSDGFYLLDTHWCFTYLNREAERLLRRSRDSLIGKLFWAEFPEAAARGDFDDYRRAMTEQTSLHREIYDPAAGEWLALDLHPSNEGLAIYFRVITAQKALEDHLRQSQRLESVGQLTGGVAHDFNNLLTVILGNAEILAELLQANPRQRSLAEMIAGAAERGAALTRHLLAFARKQALDPKPTDVNQLVARLDGLLRRTLGEHIEIAFVRGAGQWRTMIDPVQLESALLNLSLNARDAMPDGGRLTIETANARIDQNHADQHPDLQAGQYVMLAISDTGAGIPAKILPRVFEPFFTTKEQGKGTGLGLSMVFGFVKQSGGHVSIGSEPGQGTTVKLYLPRLIGPDDGAHAVPLAAVAAAEERGQEIVLLVEDDALVRSYARSQLESLGYAVLEADCGPAALEILDQRRDIDLLFTDVVMPGGMTGRQLAEEALRRRPRLKVLYTSGYGENAIVHHGRLDPDVHLLGKPYRRMDLSRKLRELLDAT
ncbi:MAG: hypothetical protein NVS9B10_06820 [Nevskia sp.]